MKPKVTQLTENSFEVNGHHVKLQKKKGRTLLLCDCINHTKFCLENPFCSHKEMVIEHLITKKFKDKIDKLIPVYENWIKLKLPINPTLCLDDLKTLRRMI